MSNIMFYRHESFADPAPERVLTELSDSKTKMRDRFVVRREWLSQDDDKAYRALLELETPTTVELRRIAANCDIPAELWNEDFNPFE